MPLGCGGPQRVVWAGLASGIRFDDFHSLIACAFPPVRLYFGIDHPGGFPWNAALSTGVRISATDPLSVRPLTAQLEAPRRRAVGECRRRQPVAAPDREPPLGERAALLWGGERGAATLAFALSLPGAVDRRRPLIGDRPPRDCGCLGKETFATGRRSAQSARRSAANSARTK
jgi:hypothetical protein